MHRLRSCDLQALELRPSGCGTWASLLLGLRNLPRPEIESVSPASVGRFLSTVPSEKSWVVFLSTFYRWRNWDWHLHKPGQHKPPYSALALFSSFSCLCGLTKDRSPFLGLLVMRSELVFCHQLRLVILGYLQLSRTALAEIAGTAHCQSDCQYQ